MTDADTQSFSVFAEDLVRAKEEAKAARTQLDELERQKNEHADNAKKARAEAQAASDNYETERVAHADTKAKVGVLQERVGRLDEAERKYAEAVSQLDGKRSRLVQRDLEVKSLGERLGGTASALKETEAKLVIAEDRLAAFEKLARALDDHRAAKDVIAAESARLRG